jgi:streptogramin lyase
MSLSLVLAATTLLVLLGVVSAAPVAEEVALTGCILGCDLNRNGDGRLTLSDYDARELWHIEPASGVYTIYDVSGRPVDAQSDGQGHIWWSDAADSFSRLTLATGVQTTWVLTNFESLSGVAVDDSGMIWFSEWFGSQSKLHRFDPAGNQWCSYTYPGVGYSYFLLHDGQSLWTVNWFSQDIVRFTPGSMTSKRWEMVEPVGEPYGMALDQDGVLWWSDRSDRIHSLDPVTNQQRAYALPLGTGTVVERLEAGEGLIWYTESVSGTLGALDPAAAASTTTTLAAATGPASGSCVQLTPLPGESIASMTDVIAGTVVSVTTLQESEGWSVYGLPENAELQGLATAGGARWVTDMGRRQLVRLTIAEVGQLAIDKSGPLTAAHGQLVTYTYAVSYTSSDQNPAKNVVVVDDKCTPVTGPDPAGDSNHNEMLDVDETWRYECALLVPQHDENEVVPLVNEATVTGQNLDGAVLEPARDTHALDITHEKKLLFIPIIERP